MSKLTFRGVKNRKPQKGNGYTNGGLSLQQQILKALYPTFNTDFSVTLKKEQIISIYYAI